MGVFFTILEKLRTKNSIMIDERFAPNYVIQKWSEGAEFTLKNQDLVKSNDKVNILVDDFNFHEDGSYYFCASSSADIVSFNLGIVDKSTSLNDVGTVKHSYLLKGWFLNSITNLNSNGALIESNWLNDKVMKNDQLCMKVEGKGTTISVSFGIVNKTDMHLAYELTGKKINDYVLACSINNAKETTHLKIAKVKNENELFDNSISNERLSGSFRNENFQLSFNKRTADQYSVSYQLFDENNKSNIFTTSISVKANGNKYEVVSVSADVISTRMFSPFDGTAMAKWSEVIKPGTQIVVKSLNEIVVDDNISFLAAKKLVVKRDVN